AALQAQGIDLGDIPDLTPDSLLKVHAGCRHVWTENQRVLDAVKALGAGDVTWFAQLLHDPHPSARDDYEISCPEVEHLIAVLSELRGVVAARLTGPPT
ncbi:MAG: galactokinase, partial [Ardenticatenaceae bacterium]